MSQREIAQVFFEACERGQGRQACQTWCHGDATFSCQADALADTKTPAAYCDWMQGLLSPVPDGHYVLTAFAWDEVRQTALATA